MKDVVILAGTTQWSVLSLCRAASKHGGRAYCVCVGLSHKMNYSSSKYVAEAYDVDMDNLERFWERFFSQHFFSEKPILFATYDGACLLVEEKRDFYENHFVICMPSGHIIKSFNDKSIAGRVALSNGMTVPKTINIEESCQIDDVCESFSFPVIVKPTTASEHVKYNFKMKLFENARDFRSFSNILLENQCHFICQEYIQGKDDQCKFYIFYRGKKGFILDCMGEKTLQSNGIMAIGTTKHDETLNNLCRSFVEKIDYIGIGGIEVKLYNGTYYFIEMSTRTEGFIPISDMAGVSLAEAAYEDLNEITLHHRKQREDIRYVVRNSWIRRRVSSYRFIKLIREAVFFCLDSKTFFVGRYLK